MTCFPQPTSARRAGFAHQRLKPSKEFTTAFTQRWVGLDRRTMTLHSVAVTLRCEWFTPRRLSQCFKASPSAVGIITHHACLAAH
jgi:hypothetical protein